MSPQICSWSSPKPLANTHVGRLRKTSRHGMVVEMQGRHAWGDRAEEGVQACRSPPGTNSSNHRKTETRANKIKNTYNELSTLSSFQKVLNV